MSTSRLTTARLIRSGINRDKILLRTNILLLSSLIMIIFILPVVPIKDAYMTRILLGIVVISGLYAADFSRSAFRILFTLGSIAVSVTFVNLIFHDERILSLIAFLLNTLFFIIVTIALVAHIASATEVDISTLLCAINSYLLIGLTVSILFLIIDLNVPGSFNELDAGDANYSRFIYFGFVTLTTLGYGDITPDTATTRSLASFTALFGQLYLVIIMALIIGKYLNSNRGKNQEL